MESTEPVRARTADIINRHIARAFASRVRSNLYGATSGISAGVAFQAANP